MSLKVVNTEKGLHHFLTTLRDFNIEKGLNHFHEILKGFNFENWLNHNLMALKVFQNGYFVESDWQNAGGHFWRSLIISYLWWTNVTCSDAKFHSIGNILLFGTKFFWNEGIDTYFNVEYVLLCRNFDFLGGYLVVTARYRLLLLLPTF